MEIDIASHDTESHHRGGPRTTSAMTGVTNAAVHRGRVRLSDGADIALAGAGSGPVVLFLHGIGGSSRQWERALLSLAPRHCALAWDARGYGESRGAPVSRFGDFADDLFGVLHALGIARALVVGHSMGGRILLEAARIDQSRFAGMVLSGAQSAYLEHMTPAERQSYVENRQALFAGEAMRPDAAARVAQGVLAPGTGDEIVDEMVESFMALKREGYLAALAASVGMDARDVLGRITVPTRVVGGSLDTVCPAEETRRIAEAIGQGPAEILQGVGHMPNLEAPDRFLAAIGPFLAAHASQATSADSAALLGAAT